MNPRLTMSRLRSGSRTTFSASRMADWSTCMSPRISYTRRPMPEVPPNRGVMIVLAYLWPLALVPLVLDRADPDVQWHARHGIVLMIAELLLVAAYLVVASMVRLAAFGLGGALLAFVVFAWVGILAL